MILIGYHGTNTEIEVFDLNHLGSGQGQSRFPGIYFSENFEAAKNYSGLAVNENGGEPRVYVAECLLEKPLDVRKGAKLFNSFGEILVFLKGYLPQWFDENGNLLPYKEDYVTSKYETYDGQYSLIKYVSEVNDIPLIEVCLGLGFDSWVGDTEFVITSPQQILSFMEVDHQLSPDEINQERLPADESLYTPERASAFETTSNQYIQASKKGRPYKTKPGNRFLRRVYIKMNGGNNVWFDIDMNRLFRKGSFAIKIPVVGETKEYIDIISFEDWLPKLKDDIARTGFTQLTVKRSLMEMLRFHNLKVHCTCPDWKYRFQYWATINGEEEGDPETRPANKTNPRNDLGKLCKHLNFCFIGDTKIRTLDGKTQTLIELKKRFDNGESLWAYSVDSKGDFVPGKITDVFETGEVTNLCKITLDNGKTITCTPDHLFMARSGEWVMAKDLSEGFSLMPLYFNKSKKGYELVRMNSTGKFSPTYFRVANNLYRDKIEKTRIDSAGENRPGVAIHHKDFHKENNSPENLEVMTICGHIRYHSENGSFIRLWKDPVFREKYSRVSSEFMSKLQANPTEALLESRRNPYWKGKSLPEEVCKKISQSNLGKKRSKETREKMSMSSMGRTHSEETRKKLSTLKSGVPWNEKMRASCSTENHFIKKSQSQKRVWENYSEEKKKLLEEKRVKTRKLNRSLGLSKDISEISYSKDNSGFSNLTPEYQRKILRRIRKIILSVLNSGENLTPENYNKIRVTFPLGYRTRWQLAFKTLDEAVSFYQINHKVVKVEILEVPLTKVYDLTVENYHNFLVEDSVIVHNCLNNKVWGDKESRIIYNYMINLKRTQRKLFDKLIAPKLGLETQEEEEERLEAERLEREKPNQVNDQVEQELEDQVQGEQPIEQTKELGEGGENNQ